MPAAFNLKAAGMFAFSDAAKTFGKELPKWSDAFSAIAPMSIFMRNRRFVHAMPKLLYAFSTALMIASSAAICASVSSVPLVRIAFATL